MCTRIMWGGHVRRRAHLLEIAPHARVARLRLRNGVNPLLLLSLAFVCLVLGLVQGALVLLRLGDAAVNVSVGRHRTLPVVGVVCGSVEVLPAVHARKNVTRAALVQVNLDLGLLNCVAAATAREYHHLCY